MHSRNEHGLGAALKALGLNAESFERIKLGAGAIGISARVALACFGVFAIVAWRGGPELLPWVLATATGFGILFIGSTLIFAALRPGPALLGGGELLRWQAMQTGTKLEPTLPATNAIENPALTAPEHVE